jgi:two-component system LytT family sensor kinase
MREVLTVHEPLLVNTLGHLAGTLIFAIFVYLLFRDRVGARLRGSHLTITAALLALAWNFASLLVIAWNSPGSLTSEWLVAVSSSALSLLPAVLLHLSLGGRFNWIWRTGYALATVTVGIHLSEFALNSPENHEIALRMTSLGFGVLTLASVAGLVTNPGDRRRLTPRLVGTMSLFLFSLSFVHLGAAVPRSWPVELLAHHAGIALALFVLLQDYRFLLLDAFLRFLANIFLAAAFVFAVVGIWDWRAALAWASDPFREGLLLAGGCMLLLFFAFLRARLDHLLSRLVSLKNDLDAVLQELRNRAAAFDEDSGFLEWASHRIAEFFRAPLVTATGGAGFQERPSAHLPAPVSDLPPSQREPLEALGVEAVLPLRLATNDLQYILLGRRQGGRRYLSEDFAALRRLQAELIEQMDRRRELEMRRLVSQAELRALQSQIHPHFLFNALNTLYGIIPKDAAGARRTVLNLADIFRYFLQSDRTFIPLAKEMEIVRAYLEIEALRLGNKLETQIDIAPDALAIPIPVLTVEPLVENAVKHGVARKSEGGRVRVEARVESGNLRIRVLDTGSGFQADDETSSTGVGLENVLKRLRLCYGPDAGLQIESSTSGTSVGFLVPIRQAEAIAR